KLARSASEQSKPSQPGVPPQSGTTRKRGSSAQPLMTVSAPAAAPSRRGVNRTTAAVEAPDRRGKGFGGASRRKSPATLSRRVRSFLLRLVKITHCGGLLVPGSCRSNRKLCGAITRQDRAGAPLAEGTGGVVPAVCAPAQAGENRRTIPESTAILSRWAMTFLSLKAESDSRCSLQRHGRTRGEDSPEDSDSG